MYQFLYWKTHLFGIIIISLFWCTILHITEIFQLVLLLYVEYNINQPLTFKIYVSGCSIRFFRKSAQSHRSHGWRKPVIYCSRSIWCSHEKPSIIQSWVTSIVQICDFMNWQIEINLNVFPHVICFSSDIITNLFWRDLSLEMKVGYFMRISNVNALGLRVQSL